MTNPTKARARLAAWLVLLALLGCSPKPVDFSRAGEGRVPVENPDRTVADIREGETTCAPAYATAEGKPFVLSFSHLKHCRTPLVGCWDWCYEITKHNGHLVSRPPRAPIPAERVRSVPTDGIPVLIEGAAAERKP